MKPVRFAALAADSVGYYLWLGACGLLAAIGIAAAWYIDHHGHHVTGMNNQIVWGMPHVFAIFLIVTASGVLNVASVASVFGRLEYRALGRFAALLAIVFLAGGLAVLVLDLGRPDRLIVAMTYYNFKSVFAWNIFLYTGFFVVVSVYLWTMFERRMRRYVKASGVITLLWRLVLTSATGFIFGFLVARQAYDAAIMAPLFVVMSLASGLAVFIVVLMATFHFSHRRLGDWVLFRLRRMLGMFVATVLYFTLAYKLLGLYAPEHQDIEAFFLKEGGIYPLLFWVGQIGFGSIVPLLLLYLPAFQSRRMLLFGSVLALIGTVIQIYIIVVGGQAYPLVMFPGFEESSSFFDGVVNAYTPSMPEILLGVGGIGIALVLLTFLLAVLDFLPENLSNKQFDWLDASVAR